MFGITKFKHLKAIEMVQGTAQRATKTIRLYKSCAKP